MYLSRDAPSYYTTIPVLFEVSFYNVYISSRSGKVDPEGIPSISFFYVIFD